MLRHYRMLFPLVVLVVLYTTCGTVSAQSVQDFLTNTSTANVLLNSNTTETVDPEAVRKAIEQMNALVDQGVKDATNIKPTFDGKNMRFNIDGQIYVFDISEKVTETTQALTSIVVTPPAPRAHEDVEVRISNFGTNLMEDRITWTVDGKVVQDQIGGTSIHLTVGDVGESTNIVVTVLSRKLGDFFSKDITLTPGDVAILWEANTYIPPFYKGKPLPTYKSTIKLVPFPTIKVGQKLISPENLLYRWSRNYRNMNDMSGYGKRYVFLETGGGIQEERLKLSVSHPDSGAETERSVVISVVQPKVLLYSGSPLQGTRYEQALGNTFQLGTQETTLKGEPFFFSREELEDGTSPLVWKQNGKGIPSLYRSVILQKPEVSGTSRIEASINNPKRILQSGKAGLTITYSSNN